MTLDAPIEVTDTAIRMSHAAGGVVVRINGDHRHHVLLRAKCWEYDDAPSKPEDPAGTFAREYWAGKLQPWRVRLICNVPAPLTTKTPRPAP